MTALLCSTRSALLTITVGAEIQIPQPLVEARVAEKLGDRVPGKEKPGMLPSRRCGLYNIDYSIQGQEGCVVAAARLVAYRIDERPRKCANTGLFVRASRSYDRYGRAVS